MQEPRWHAPKPARHAAGNTALHLAAAAGNLDACKLLVELGADPLKRNKVNRTPGKQIRLQPDMKDYFLDVEAAAVQARSAKQHGLWDDKIKATLTESALRIGCL